MLNEDEQQLNSPDMARQIDENILHSFNLKTENNLDDYLVLIVDSSDEANIVFKNVQDIVGIDYVLAFDESAKALSFILGIREYAIKIFLIISGTLGQTNAHDFAQEANIMSIYVYCREQNNHVSWTSKIDKIQCIISDKTRLLTRLHNDIKEFMSRWDFTDGGEKSFQKASSITAEWYHLFIRIICHRPPNISRSNKEMLDECRAYYRNKRSISKYIDEFAQKYSPEKAIYYYTKDSFVYRVVNHALRTQNMKVVKKFGPFIADVYSQLRELHWKYINEVSSGKQQSIRYVYRGQYMRQVELEYIMSACKSGKSIIALTTFGSASLDPQVALNFIENASFQNDNRVPCLLEIVIPYDIYLEPIGRGQVRTAQPFANISYLSAIQQEEEVLFSLGTYFRVKAVGEITKGRSWVPIELELVYNSETKIDPGMYSIGASVEKETDPQIYADILDMLQLNASPTEFNKTNWKKWWSTLSHKWGTRVLTSQSLLLTLYESFADKYWLRKAIELRKKEYGAHNDFTNATSISSFFEVLRQSRCETKTIAVFEAYFKPFFSVNNYKTVESMEIFYLAGKAYEAVYDNERALLCYNQAIEMSNDIETKILSHVNERIKACMKSTEKLCISSIVENKRAGEIERERSKELRQKYEAQEEQWSTFWRCISIKKNKLGQSIKNRLDYLQTYLIKRENWYDRCELYNLFRLSYEKINDHSVSYYRYYFMQAVRLHIEKSPNAVDPINHRILTLWRYEKYMREWLSLKELQTFLKPYKLKVDIRTHLVLNRLIEKLSLLITLCTIYLCVAQRSGKVIIKNINNIPINCTQTMKLVGFDYRDKEIQAGLEACLNHGEEFRKKSSYEPFECESGELSEPHPHPVLTINDASLSTMNSPLLALSEQTTSLPMINVSLNFNHLNQQSVPNLCFNIRKGYYWSNMATAHDKYLLYASEGSLCLINAEGHMLFNVKQDFKINDICWSSYLNQFLVLSGENWTIYSLDIAGSRTEPYVQVRISNTMNEYNTCTCYEETFLIGGNTLIEEYNLSNWRLIRTFKLSTQSCDYDGLYGIRPPIICKIRFNSSGTHIGVINTDFSVHLNYVCPHYFELRSRDELLKVLQTIDIKECVSIPHLLSIPIDQFLIYSPGSNQLLLTDSNGRLKETTSYQSTRNIQSVALLNDNKCLAIRTETHLHFHDV